jgi:Fur family ferric uptake transcriptional regulator
MKRVKHISKHTSGGRAKAASKPHSHSPISNDINATLDATFAALRSAGLKRTPNRENLIRFLIQNHGPFSKDEIMKALPKGDFDGVTLYRNLARLEENGILRRSEFGDGISRYEFQSHPEDHHHHIVCTGCRRIDSLDSCVLPKLDAIIEELGYSKVRHSLEFFGLCTSCTKKAA